MYLKGITKKKYQEALPMAAAVKAEILNRIRGSVRPASSCCCGAIRLPEAQVIDVDIPGADYPAQIAGFFSWTANMSADGVKRDYSCGLSEFLSYDQLDEIFARHFGSFVEANFPRALSERTEKPFWI